MPDTAGLLSGDIAPSVEGGASLLATLAGLRNANLDSLSYQPPLADPADRSQLAAAALDPRLLQQNAGVALGIGPGVIRGFHGTPHTFEPVEGNPFGEFRNEAIGSGEGAQAYGWGHYVAGNPKVAEDYQKQLSGPGGWTGRVASLDGNPIYTGSQGFTPNATSLDQAARDAMSMVVTERGVNNATASLLDQISKPLHVEKFPEIVQSAKEALSWLDQNADRIDYKEPAGGHLLEVHIHPDEDQLLDWDKPLSEQSQQVQQKLEPFVHGLRGESPLSLAFGRDNSFLNPTGNDIYKSLSQVTHTDRDLGKDAYNLVHPFGRGDAAVSAALHEAGIPGIKYLDAGSRGGPSIADIEKQIDYWNEIKAKYQPDYERNLKDFGPDSSWTTNVKYHLDDADQHIENLNRQRPTHNYVIFHPSNLRIVARDGTPLEPVDHDPFAPAGQ